MTLGRFRRGTGEAGEAALMVATVVAFTPADVRALALLHVCIQTGRFPANGQTAALLPGDSFPDRVQAASCAYGEGAGRWALAEVCRYVWAGARPGALLDDWERARGGRAESGLSEEYAEADRIAVAFLASIKD